MTEENTYMVDQKFDVVKQHATYNKLYLNNLNKFLPLRFLYKKENLLILFVF